MSHCRKWEEEISLLVLGEISATQAEVVRMHMDSCERCRLFYGEISSRETFIVAGFESMVAGGRRFEQELLERAARNELLSKGAGASSDGRHAIIRYISKIAAGIVIVAGLIGLLLLGINTGGGSRAFAEIVRPIVESRTCTFSVMTRGAGTADSGIHRGMFAVPGKMRLEGENGSVGIFDFEQRKMLMLMPDEKRAMIMEFQNMPAEKVEEAREFSFFSVRETIAKASGSAEYLGERQIEGRTAVGYRLEEEAMTDTEIWADAKTLLPIRIETWTKLTGVESSAVMSDFVFDVELDDSLFSLQVPEGYESVEMQVDASLPQEQELIAVLRSCAEANGGAFPSELTAEAFVRGTRLQKSPPPFELTNEQKAELQDELSLILADVKANLLQLEAIAKGRRQPENLDLLGEEIDDDLRQLAELEQKKQSLEDQVQKTYSEWTDNCDTNVLHIMRDAYKEGWPAGRALAFLQMLGPDSDWCYAGSGVILGEGDTPIFRYKPKDSDKYRILYGDLTIKEVAADNIPEMPQMPQPPQPHEKTFDANSFSTARQLSAEQEFIWSLGVFTDFCDGNFPSSIGIDVSQEFEDYQSRRLSVNGRVPDDLRRLSGKMRQIIVKVVHFAIYDHAMLFPFCLDAESDFCYAGRGVTTQDVDTPIFWYKPDGAELYRVIYADLSVESVLPQNLPQPPQGAETYEDLHRELETTDSEPEAPSDPEAVAVLQQVQAAYSSIQTYQTTQTSTCHSVSTAVVDANELADILPKSCRDIVHSQEFSQTLTDESDWSKSFRVTLTRPSNFLVEEASNAAAPEAAWYEDGEYHLFSFDRLTSSGHRACPPFADDTIVELFYDPNETFGDLEGAHLLGDETLAGHPCHVVAARKLSREFTFWITKDTHLILKTIEISQYENVPSNTNKELLNNSLVTLERAKPAYRAQFLRSLIHHYLAKQVMVNSKTITTYDLPVIDSPVSPEQLVPTAYRQEISGRPNPAEILRRAKEKYDSLDTYVTTGVVDNDFRRMRFDDVNNLPGVPRDTALKLLANEDFRKLLATGRRSIREFTLRFSRPHYCMEWLIDGQKRNAAWSDSAGHHTLVGGHHTVRQLYVSNEDLWSFGTTIHPIFYDGYNNLLKSMTDLRLLPDETVNGDTCYVIAGVRYSGKFKFTLWISRQTLLIRKLLIDYEGNDKRKLKLTDDEAGRVLHLLEKEPTDENRKWLEQLIEGGFLAAGHFCGRAVETYPDITVNTPLSPEQLVPEIAANAATANRD